MFIAPLHLSLSTYERTCTYCNNKLKATTLLPLSRAQPNKETTHPLCWYVLLYEEGTTSWI